MAVPAGASRLGSKRVLGRGRARERERDREREREGQRVRAKSKIRRQPERKITKPLPAEPRKTRDS